MDDKLTKTFMRVCQQGSIRAVAIELEQEPSTISRRLSALENELNIQLLERRRKGVIPTEAGELLLAHLRGQATEFEALTAELDALRGMRRGSVSLAVGEGFVSDLIKNALPDFKNTYPEITFSIRSGTTETVVQDVQNDTAHLGFVFNAVQDRQCKVLAKMPQPLELLVSPKTSWAHANAPVSIDMLTDMPLALLMPGSGIGSLVRDVEAIYGVRFKQALEVNSLTAVLNFVREGLGVTVFPAFVAAREIEDHAITTLPLSIPKFASGEVRLISRAGRRLPDATMKFADHAMRSMQAFRVAT